MPPTKNDQPPSKRRRRDPVTGRFLPTISISGPSPPAQEQETSVPSSLITTPDTDSSHGMAPPTSAPKRKYEEEDEEAGQQESAVERVFCINELVEEILSYLCPAELLRAQAVKQTFQAVYKSSKQLQLKTFERIHSTSKQVQPLEINPLLAQWVQDNKERQLRDYGVIVAPPSMPHVCFSEGYGEGHGEGYSGSRMLRVRFPVDDGEQVEIDHTKSWMKQHIPSGSSYAQIIHSHFPTSPCHLQCLTHIDIIDNSPDIRSFLGMNTSVRLKCSLNSLLDSAHGL